jgi:hypothetical protein
VSVAPGVHVRPRQQVACWLLTELLPGRCCLVSLKRAECCISNTFLSGPYCFGVGLSKFGSQCEYNDEGDQGENFRRIRNRVTGRPRSVKQVRN